MSYQIHDLYIADDSPEARVIDRIVNEENVTPEEAVRRALRQLVQTDPPKVDPLWGLLADDPETADAIDAVYRDRRSAYDR